MRNAPYRHSVWIDVFGVVLFGAVLLIGAGYLLYHAGGAASNLGGGQVAAEGSPASPLASRPARSARPGNLAAPRSRSGAPWEGQGRSLETRAPFSDQWQKQATPNLTGPSGSSSTPGGGGEAGGAAPDRSGHTIASRRPSGGHGGGTVQPGGGNAGSGWRAEARRFSGRARALSNQIGALARSSSEEPRGKVSSKETSGRSSAAGASTNDRNVGDPPSVPIGDHVHWLAVLGVLWGAWRIWRGG